MEEFLVRRSEVGFLWIAMFVFHVPVELAVDFEGFATYFADEGTARDCFCWLFRYRWRVRKWSFLFHSNPST